MRNIIIHYHIFKNAGSSVDKALENSFGEKWTNWDASGKSGKISPNALRDFIIDNPNLRAVSSHSAIPPLPIYDGITCHPLVFIRHPIIRAYSAYQFEWGKQEGRRVERDGFSTYIKDKLRLPRKNAIEDFQVIHLANRGPNGHGPSAELNDQQLLQNAKMFLEDCSFFGLVERFNESMVRAHMYFKARFPEFNGSIHKVNVTTKTSWPKIKDEAESILATLPKEIRSTLLERNQLDLELYNYATERFKTMGLDKT
jgi:hypothetical protein